MKQILANKTQLMEIPPEAWVLIPEQGIRIDAPDFLEINPKNTIQCCDELTEEEWSHISTGPLFRTLFNDVFEDMKVAIPETKQALTDADMGVQHIAGLIVLSIEAIFPHKRFAKRQNLFYRNPETYLHPAACQNIMTMMYKLKALAGDNTKPSHEA